MHSDKTTATALTSTATQSDETPATALISTATQSDETYSSELATINGKPGSLCQRHERNASAASSGQVIASSTERRPQRALSAAQRPVSLTSGRGDLSHLRLNMPVSNVPFLVVDLTLAHAPQTWYCVDITISIAVDFAAVATAVESSVAAFLTSAAAATTLLGGDLKYRLSGYSIAIIAAVAMLAAIHSCSRLISDSEPKLKTGPNLPDGLPTSLRPLPKFSTTVSLTAWMARFVLVLLLCPGVMSTTLDSEPNQSGAHAIENLRTEKANTIGELGLTSSQHDGRQLAHSTTIVGSGSIVGSVASASLLDYALGVAVSGSYAYVTAAWSDSLVVIDVSNPASPVIRGSVLSSSLMDGVRVTQSSVARMASGAAHAPSPSIVLASAAPPPVDSLSRSHSLALTCCAHRRMASP